MDFARDFSTEWVPLFNLALGALGFVILLMRTMRRREEYPSDVLLTLITLLLFIFAVLIASAEQFALRSEVSFTAFAITFAKVFLLYVLWKTRATKFGTRRRRPDHKGQDREK